MVKDTKSLNANEVAHLSALDDSKNVRASYVKRALGMLARGEGLPAEEKAAPAPAPAPKRAAPVRDAAPAADKEEADAEGD